MNNNSKEFFQKEIQALGIDISTKQLEQFYLFYEMLIEKNKVMNLTSITEFDEVIKKHFLDSISLVKVADLKKDIRIIDMGTGAGFPGIPLKIAFPNIEITLMDSLNKRIGFLDEVVDRLGLSKVHTIHGRAEDIARDPKYRENYDICVSRAVANLSTLSEYCLPFVQIGGSFISYKSGECDNEIAEAKSAIFLLGGKLKEITKFDLYESKRSFVVIEKTQGTSNKYPRKAGMPTKKPL